MWERFVNRWKYNWTLGRGILLGLGLAAVGYNLVEYDGLTLIFGLILLVQAYYNTPCLFGLGACRVDLDGPSANNEKRESDKNQLPV